MQTSWHLAAPVTKVIYNGTVIYNVHSFTNMSFSDEDIIAYLLGEAEASLSARIEDCLHSDSLLAERVNYLRLMLSHLSGAGHCFEPPDGLIEATMRRMSEADSETGQIEPSSSHGQPANSEIAAPQPYPVHSAPKHSAPKHSAPKHSAPKHNAPKSRGGGILGWHEWGSTISSKMPSTR